MKKSKLFLNRKAPFIIMIMVLNVIASSVLSQIVTSNLRINDDNTADVTASAKSLAVTDDNVYVVWSDDRTGVDNIYFSKSADGGMTFSTDLLLSGLNDQNINLWPSIVADESGGVYVTWTGFTGSEMGSSGVNIWFTKSTNHGNSFDTPIQITSDDGSVFPSIGVYNDFVHIFYCSMSEGEKEKSMPPVDYFLVSSSDGGNNFQAPLQVNDQDPVESVSGNNNTSLDIDPITGDLYMVWIDGRREGGKDDIYFAKATDNGSSISANIRVNGLETDWAEFDKPNPTVLVGTTNMVYAAYPINNGYSRIIIAESTNDGDSFTSEGLLDGNDNHCNENDYDITVFPDGTIGFIKITNLHDMGWHVWVVQPGETSLIFNDVDADFRHPSLAICNNNHAHAVWVDDREGSRNLYYARTINYEDLFAGGSGTSIDPWEIETAEHLNNVRFFLGDEHSDKHFIQLEDIDFEASDFINGEGWEPIGNQWEPFMGNYDGDYKIIENLTINRPTDSNVGLFGTIRGATVENLGVVNANVISNRKVGILVGEAEACEVNNCYSTGIVTGNLHDIGGLIGFIDNTNVVQCYSTAEVNGGAYLGGLVGVNENGQIINSYSTGNVSGSIVVGGLVGENVGTINNSYSTGAVSGTDKVGGLIGLDDGAEQISNSYWDIIASGQENSDGGEGKTTNEMVFSLTFETWNFIDIWDIEEGVSYTYLQWQGEANEHNYPTFYSLTLEVHPDQEAGFVESEPSEGPYLAGTLIELLAMAGEGFEFLNWRKNGSPISTSEEFQYQMPAEDVTLVAHFKIEGTDVYEVSIDVDPAGVGYTTGQGSYEEGELITVEAFSDDPNYVFDKWTDDGSLEETDNPYSFNMPTNDVFLTANFREIISATINPDNWEFSSFEDITNVQTTVTWNDATEVTAVYLEIEEHHEYFPYNVDFINEETATIDLLFEEDFDKSAKNSKGSFLLEGYIEFDIGEPAIFTLTFTDPKWELDIWVYDELTFEGIPGAEIFVTDTEQSYYTDQEGDAFFSLPEGTYTLNISAPGYYPLEETITVEAVFDGNDYDFALMPDDSIVCEPFDIPLSEDFDDVAVPDLPDCWFANTDAGGAVETTLDFSNSPPNSIKIMKEPGDEVYLITPNLNADIGDLSIYFYAKAVFVASGSPTLEIGTMGDPNDTETFNYITHVTVPEDSYMEFSVEFTGYEGSHKHIAFRLSNEIESQDIDISIDDIFIDYYFDDLFAGGSGTIAEPWQIATIEHLYNIRYYLGEEHTDKYFIQIEDIDFEGSDFIIGEGWEPIGNPFEVFQGNYDGNNKIIENLMINRPDDSNVGLFGYIRNATIENLGIVNADVTAGSKVGALIGGAGSNNVVYNCYSTGTVTAISIDAGGLIGISDAYVNQCYSTANVSAGTYVGGLIGANDGEIVQSYSTGDVSGTIRVGGLVGENDGTITNSYSTGSVSGSEESQSIGGLVGINAGEIIDCYSTGHVSGDNAVGGLVGLDDEAEPVINSYWDINTSGQDSSDGGEGKTTTEMITSSTFSAWDFSETWSIEEGESYPYLQWQTEPGDHNYPVIGTYSLTLLVSPEGAGSVTGEGVYEEGEEVSVAATANEGYVFVNWTDSDGAEQSSDAEYTFTMPAENVELTANFLDISSSICVTNGDNDGFGSLRWAVSLANQSDQPISICFNIEDNDTIVVSQEISISNRVNIDGINLFNDNNVVVQVDEPGVSDWRVFNIDAPEDSIYISNMTVMGGNLINIQSYGGGILVAGNSILNLDNVRVTASAASKGGGIYTSGTVMLSNSIINENHAEISGGGIYNNGELSLYSTDVYENSVDEGSTGSGIANDGSLSVEGSNVYANSWGSKSYSGFDISVTYGIVMLEDSNVDRIHLGAPVDESQGKTSHVYKEEGYEDYDIVLLLSGSSIDYLYAYDDFSEGEKTARGGFAVGGFTSNKEVPNQLGSIDVEHEVDFIDINIQTDNGVLVNNGNLKATNSSVSKTGKLDEGYGISVTYGSVILDDSDVDRIHLGAPVIEEGKNIRNYKLEGYEDYDIVLLLAEATIDYLYAYDDSTEEDKTARGGFAVGGFTTGKRPPSQVGSVVIEHQVDFNNILIHTDDGMLVHKGNLNAKNSSVRRWGKPDEGYGIAVTYGSVILDDSDVDRIHLGAPVIEEEGKNNRNYKLEGYEDYDIVLLLADAEIDYLYAFDDYTEEDKTARGGFAVGGFTSNKEAQFNSSEQKRGAENAVGQFDVAHEVDFYHISGDFLIDEWSVNKGELEIFRNGSKPGAKIIAQTIELSGGSFVAGDSEKTNGEIKIETGKVKMLSSSKNNTVVPSFLMLGSGVSLSKPQHPDKEDAFIEIGANCAITLKGNASVSANEGEVLFDMSDDASVIIDGDDVVLVGSIRVQRLLTDSRGFVSAPVANYDIPHDEADFAIWDEPGMDWEPVSTGVFEQMKGYYADFEDDMLLINFTGDIPQATQSIDLTNSNVENINEYGWNFVGNPYTSALDFEVISETFNGIENVYYTLDPETGNYRVYQKGGLAINNGSRLISVGRGFFLKSTVENSTFGLGKGKVHNIIGLLDLQDVESKTTNDYVLITVSNETFSDQTLVGVSENATNTYQSNMDALKLFAPEIPQLYTVINENGKEDINLAINIIDIPFADVEVVPMNFRAEDDQEFTIAASGGNSKKHITAHLKDLVTGDVTMITDGGSYTFTTDGIEDRFELYFEHTYSIDFHVADGFGTISAEVDGEEINSGSKVSEGKDVMFTATPSYGYKIYEWTINGEVVEDYTSSTLIINEVTENLSISVAFESALYNLTIAVEGQGITMPEAGTHEYVEGTTVVLYASALEGNEFEKWIINEEEFTTQAIQLTITSDVLATAYFVETEDPQFNLTINIEGQGTTLPPGGTHVYNEGQDVSLNAFAEAGWVFEGWSGDLESTDATETITMDSDKTITATFTEIVYHTLTINIVGQGLVEVDGLVYTEAVTVEEGSILALEAIADAGWIFEDWSGDLVSTDATETITMDSDKTITATFMEIVYHTLTINIVGQGLVEVDSEPYTEAVTVEDGSILALEAIAADGWIFEGWSGDLVSTDVIETITMDDDKNITATFSEDVYISMVNDHDIIIYPNPSPGIINIVSSVNINEIQVLDLAGKIQYVQKPVDRKAELILNNLKPGIYFVRIYTDKGVTIRKLQIVK